MLRRKPGLQRSLRRGRGSGRFDGIGKPILELLKGFGRDLDLLGPLERWRAFFLGDRCRTDFYNTRLYRDGEGCFPLPLLAATPLLVDRLDKSADIDVTLPDHPVFRVFAGERNSFLNLVNIERFITAPKGWQPASDSSTNASGPSATTST